MQLHLSLSLSLSHTHTHTNFVFHYNVAINRSQELNAELSLESGCNCSQGTNMLPPCSLFRLPLSPSLFPPFTHMLPASIPSSLLILPTSLPPSLLLFLLLFLLLLPPSSSFSSSSLFLRFYHLCNLRRLR